MKQKWSILFRLILIFSLLVIGSSSAQAIAPTEWTRVPFATSDSPNTGVNSMVVFKGNLFVASQDYENGLRVWRMESNGSWKQVTEAGFGDPLLSTPEQMIAYNGMLYIAAGDWRARTVGQIWRSPDGVNWEPVTQDGFGQSELSLFERFVAFNDMLYVSAGMRSLPDGTLVPGQIWRSAAGAPGTWQKVVDNGMGDPQAIDINDFIVFKGALYAEIQTDAFHPTRIWRTSDGVNWEVTKDDGFGYLDPLPDGLVYYDTPGAFAIFHDYLYIGLATIRMDTIDWSSPENNTGIGVIWRTKDGNYWEPVMQGGFGDWRNHKIDAMVTYEGKLYAFAWVDNWVQGVYEEGMQVWRSSDGLHFTQINESGFGDAYNWSTHMSIDVAAYKGSLYVGTLNDNGGQIWKLSTH